MTDETGAPQGAAPEGGEFGIVLPPNARMSTMQLNDAAGTALIVFADDGSERTVKADQIVALHGARIRHELLIRTPKKLARSDIMSGAPGRTVSAVAGELVSTEERMHFALALRIAGVGELWYMAADSFNFRKALGPDAAYSTEINFRALVRKLAAFAKGATQDAFFTAILGNLPLPPPLGSLIEFFKTAGKDLT